MIVVGSRHAEGAGESRIARVRGRDDRVHRPGERIDDVAIALGLTRSEAPQASEDFLTTLQRLSEKDGRVLVLDFQTAIGRRGGRRRRRVAARYRGPGLDERIAIEGRVA